jgi:NAD-dependent deacetylase
LINISKLFNNNNAPQTITMSTSTDPTSTDPTSTDPTSTDPTSTDPTSTEDDPKIYIFTGAGLSAASGIPTFRDAGGIWEKYDLNKVCNYRTWQSNRDQVFEFYGSLNKKYGDARPNNAHKFIAKLQQDFGVSRVNIVTQNIDNLLEKAGCRDVLHLHGKVGHLQCTTCQSVWLDDIDPDIRCVKCNSTVVKPFVVMFHEQAPNYRPMIKTYRKKLKKNDIFIVIGTNGKVVNLREKTAHKSDRYVRRVKYWHTNYMLNVMDDDHTYEIPKKEEFYGKESCETFLPKVKDFIYGHM